MEEEPGTKRIQLIDVARFYGIALVFYGHYIEELMLLQNPTASHHYKLIYSFHMVLFIVLAGYVSKDQAGMNLTEFVKNRFVTRLLPFIFFTLFMIVPTFFFEGKFFNLNLPSLEGYSQGIVSTLFGLPLFCVPSWFLLLIIGVELVHFCAFRFLHNSEKKILITIILFYIFGYLLNLKLDIFNPLKGRTIGWNYFFIHEAITLYSFYLIGIYMKRKGLFLRPMPIKIAGPCVLAAFAVVLSTYQLNRGPFNFHVYDAVVILFASHGHILLFPLTAAAGCLLILFIAALFQPPRLLVYMGQNTLALMCLNGIFYHYINQPLAKRVLADFGESSIAVTISGITTTVISLLLCLPFLYFFNRYIPQLVGKKKHRVS